ncbi:MAG: ATP synthase F1 subunit gamma [Chloroherpetonaceae bacterium]|nr:ATP synthase F1 subunit gamma [Chthonomonadaceae bacterium]MDW8207111.1 ATP synthase F1 subunit gamma [Chloroherpetonaceae bacterium]
MATIRQVRQRIRVARNIQQITKAMKMVAAARLKRAQDRVQAARPYARTMQEMMEHLARTVGGHVEHPLLAVRTPRNIGFLIITADRGLAGSYNSAILRRAMEMIRTYDRDRLRLYVVGRKGVQFFRRRGYRVVRDFYINNTGVSAGESREITRVLREAFEKEEIDALYMLYTRFYSPISQKPVDVQLLPIVTPQATSEEGAPPNDVPPIFEPSAEQLLRALLPRYLEGQVYQALLESLASEHGARMTSMSSATDNAGKMITTLTLQMNRVRQANITREISEIVGGAEALKG